MSKEHFRAINVESDPKKGLEIAKQKLYEVCDGKTVLFLSGGTTPEPLYRELAKEGILRVGAVTMVDERAGEPFHPNSNERMIRDTRLFSYLTARNIPVELILRSGHNREEDASDYEERVRTLIFNFTKHVAILGIGPDGHTAGIAPNRQDFTNPIYNPDRKTLLVSEFADPKSMSDGGFGERITLTFNALEHMDLLIILAFGANKKETLQKMFEDGPIEEIPARFFMLPGVAKKTLLITDQQV